MENITRAQTTSKCEQMFMNKALRKQAKFCSSSSWISICSFRLEGGKVQFRNSLHHLINILCSPGAAVIRTSITLTETLYQCGLRVYQLVHSCQEVIVTPGTKRKITTLFCWDSDVFLCFAGTLCSSKDNGASVLGDSRWTLKRQEKDFLFLRRIQSDLSFDPAICTLQWNLCAHVEVHWPQWHRVVKL